MSIIVQCSRQKPSKTNENGVSCDWHAIRGKRGMRVRVTYKEFSIFTGVLVALAILLLLWINQTTPAPVQPGSFSFSIGKIFSTLSGFARSVAVVFF